MSPLAKDVECIEARLTVSNRRAKPSADLSTPLASSMSHMSISFCESFVQSSVCCERYQIQWSDKPAYHPSPSHTHPSSQIAPQPLV